MLIIIIISTTILHYSIEFPYPDCFLCLFGQVYLVQGYQCCDTFSQWCILSQIKMIMIRLIKIVIKNPELLIFIIRPVLIHLLTQSLSSLTNILQTAQNTFISVINNICGTVQRLKRFSILSFVSDRLLVKSGVVFNI